MLITKRNRKKLNVLITGSYCSLNNGDLAMVKGLLSSLGRCLPQAVFTVFSMYPNIAPERYGVRTVGIPIEPKRSYAFRLGRILLPALLHRALCGRLPSVMRNADFAEYYNADIVIDLSGDAYSDEETPLATILHSFYLFPAIMLKRPTAICAQSIGPFKTRFTKALARWVFNRTDLITTREESSKHYLNEFGLDKVVTTADCAFLLPPVGNEQIKMMMASQRIPLHNGILIGISMSKRVAKWAFPGIHKVDQKYEAFVSLMAGFSDYLIKHYDARIIYVPHVIGPPGKTDDRVVQRDIISLMKCQDRAYPLEREFLPKEIKGIVGQCDLFVGARMHSLIAATSMGVPSIALSYSHKYHGVIGQMLGLSDYIIDIRELSPDQLAQKLVEETRNLWKERIKVRTHLENTVPLVQQRAQENVDLILKVLNLP